MLEEARKAIQQSSEDSSIYIGCDSVRFKKKGKWFARYATVVVLHINSANGCKLFYKEDVLADYGTKTESLFNRLLNEATFAIGVVEQILPIIDNRHVEVHLDINPSPLHKSNQAASAACGYVLGSTGIEPKIKPDAFAAMFAADRIANFKLKNQIRNN
jgi:predicted RNase H-related nuclease YkuK (DUF458 family)